jgi:hypothetical protein
MSYDASSDQSWRFECSARSTHVFDKSGLWCRVWLRNMAVGLVQGLGLYLGSAFQGNLEKRGHHPCSTEHVQRALICIDYVGRILHFHQALPSRLLLLEG